MFSKPCPHRPDLDELLRKAAQHVMTPEEMFEQRVSFAYGNVAMSNPDVTREMVRERALAALPDKWLLVKAEEGENKEPKPRVQYKFGRGVLIGQGTPKKNDNDWMEAWGW